MRSDSEILKPLMDFQLLMLCDSTKEPNKKHVNSLPPDIIRTIAFYMLSGRRIAALMEFLSASNDLTALRKSYNDALAFGTTGTIYKEVEKTLINLLEARKDLLLMQAAKNGNIVGLAALLKLEGVNVNVGIARDWGAPLIEAHLDTPLIAAAKNGHHTVLTRLLAVPGIEVNKPNADGDTALMAAAVFNKLSCLLELLQADSIDVKAQSLVVAGDTAMMKAARCQSASSVAVLYMYQLMHAPADNIDSVVRQLDSEAATYNGFYDPSSAMTCEKLCIAMFYWAVALPERDAQVAFLEKALSPENAFLVYMSHDQKYLTLMQTLLLDLRAGREDAFITFIRGLNVDLGAMLRKTAGLGHAPAVQELLKINELDVNAGDTCSGFYQGWTALMYAAQSGYANVVELLVSVPGIAVNAQDSSANRHCALTVGAMNGHCAVVTALLKAKGINANIWANPQKPWTSIRGPQTALLYAIQNKKPDIIHELLRVNDLDFDIRDADGKTALQLLVDSIYSDFIALAYQISIKQLLNAPAGEADQTWTKLQQTMQQSRHIVFNSATLRDRFFDMLGAFQTRGQRIEWLEKAVSGENAFSVCMSKDKEVFSTIQQELDKWRALGSKTNTTLLLSQASSASSSSSSASAAPSRN